MEDKNTRKKRETSPTIQSNLNKSNLIERENKIVDNMSKLFSEWTELKLKILCREQRIDQMKRDINVVMFCFSIVIICLVILLIIGVE